MSSWNCTSGTHKIGSLYINTFVKVNLLLRTLCFCIIKNLKSQKIYFYSFLHIYTIKIVDLFSIFVRVLAFSGNSRNANILRYLQICRNWQVSATLSEWNKISSHNGAIYWAAGELRPWRQHALHSKETDSIF